MSKIVIHQPNLFPRLKVLSKIAMSDIYVIYDNVQYVRNDWQNRTKIRYLKEPNKEYWVSIPVKKINGQKTKINDIILFDFNKAKIKKQFYYAYGSSVYWNQISEYLDKVLLYKGNSLFELSSISNIEIFKILNLDIKCIYSSEIIPNLVKDKNSKLINICKEVNACTYICGSGGSTYIDINKFENQNINVIIQQWDEFQMFNKYDNLSWKNICFIDFWARYGLDELKNFLVGDINEKRNL